MATCIMKGWKALKCLCSLASKPVNMNPLCIQSSKNATVYVEITIRSQKCFLWQQHFFVFKCVHSLYEVKNGPELASCI